MVRSVPLPSPAAAPTMVSAPWVAICWEARSFGCPATTWAISCPSTAASCPGVSATSSIPVCTPMRPPGRAKAFGVSSSKSATSQVFAGPPPGTPWSTAAAMHAT